jgi:hypothetical protein
MIRRGPRRENGSARLRGAVQQRSESCRQRHRPHRA